MKKINGKMEGMLTCIEFRQQSRGWEEISLSVMITQSVQKGALQDCILASLSEEFHEESRAWTNKKKSTNIVSW